MESYNIVLSIKHMGHFLFVLLFACITCFTITSCQNDNYAENATEILEIYNHVNDKAKLFAQYLSNDKEKMKEYERVLGNNIPIYDKLSLRLNSTFGLVFAIPYTDNTNEIKGAIFFQFQRLLVKMGKK